MGRLVANWIDEAGLERLYRKGWSERSRKELPEEKRISIELHHPGIQVGEQRKAAAVTFRSLPL